MFRIAPDEDGLSFLMDLAYGFGHQESWDAMIEKIDNVVNNSRQ